MCGINGIVDFSNQPVDPADVELMRDTMIRRGPDGAGLKVLPHVGLGHRRLSIIDLSERGHQPMSNEDGSIWIVCNGEIYNFDELRLELLAKGHVFHSETDTEVLLHGYEEWGLEDLLKRINGMFAFALWDAQKRTLNLVRDRLGKKPLYYCNWGGRFYFSSDIKSIWLALGKNLPISYESVARFLYWGYIPGPNTIFREIYQLLPGSWLKLSRSNCKISRYWHLSFARKQKLQWSEALEALDDELRQAIKRRLYSDVPLGAFLSGGVDSSLVVHYMSQLCDTPVNTFTIGFEANEHDERIHARKVAKVCRTRHTEEIVNAEANSILATLVWEFGQPFGDAASIPTYFMAKAARRYVTVALTGDGGDESFAGYSQHQGRFLGYFLAKLLPAQIIDALLVRAKTSYERGGRDIGSAFKRFLRYASSNPIVSMSSINCWNEEQLKSLWPAAAGQQLIRNEVLLKTSLTAIQEFDGDNPLDKALYMDICSLLPFAYNVKVDVTTMSNSLETRSPFLDYKIVELAASLRTSFKLRPWEKKYILKKLAVRYLPREVVYRPKHGFSVPMDTWVSGSWSTVIRDTVFNTAARQRGLFDFDYLERCWQDHFNRKARHGHRFWLLFCLELWFQFFVDRTRNVGDALIRSGT